MERFGFVGLPNAGKSSLYNALAGGGALGGARTPSPRPTRTWAWPSVPDHRLDAPGRDVARANVVPAAVQFVDIGGWSTVRARARASATGSSARIREVDAIVYVLRAFADPDVPGPSDPLEHLRVLEIELTWPTSRPSRTRSTSAARR